MLCCRIIGNNSNVTEANNTIYLEKIKIQILKTENIKTNKKIKLHITATSADTPNMKYKNDVITGARGG